MTVRWDPGLFTDDRPSALCRGCENVIRPVVGGLWEDASGVTVCVKARLEDTGHGQRPDYVFHEPMPDGLLGALG
jgi:hypothetical protein